MHKNQTPPSPADTLKNKASANKPDVLLPIYPGWNEQVAALQEIQSQHDVLEAVFLVESIALEAEFEKLYEAVYTKRYEIVHGIVEVDDVNSQQPSDKIPKTKDSGIPKFWLTSLYHLLNEDLIVKADEDVLKFLKDIRCQQLEDGKGFRLEFFFDENPYFENKVLSKAYHVVGSRNKPVLAKAEATEIKWYPGKCLTQNVLRTWPELQTKECESFFHFFKNYSKPSNSYQYNGGDDDSDFDDEDYFDEFQLSPEEDYKIGSDIREKLIPNAVKWFTGQAMEPWCESQEEEEEEDINEDDFDDYSDYDE